MGPSVGRKVGGRRGRTSLSASLSSGSSFFSSSSPKPKDLVSSLVLDCTRYDAIESIFSMNARKGGERDRNW